MKYPGPFLFEIRVNEADQDSRQGYDSLYSETSLSQIRSYYLWLMKMFHLPAQGRYLDLACGAGELVRLAGQRGLQAVGVDISETVARRALPGLRPYGALAVSEGERLPFGDGSFDFISNSGSLEHFNDPAQGVREMSRLLKPGGRAFVLVPNTFSLLTTIWEAYTKGVTSADRQPIQRYGARQDWALLLEQNGLHVLRTIRYERPWPYYLPDWGYYLRRPKELARMLLSPIIPLNLSFCFLFICERGKLPAQPAEAAA